MAKQRKPKPKKVTEPVAAPVIVPATAIPAAYEVEEAQNIVFKPNAGPQTDFLAASERQVLFGGAGGGGKSYAMLADPLRDMNNPNFSGLLVRHTTEELRELIMKSQELYPKAIPGIKWSERKQQWVSPRGGTLWMSYLDRDMDVMRYQGQAFCVAEGTPVSMADGSFKNIEDILEGDAVQTIEGPKKVLFLSEPLVKKCVKITVYDLDGNVVSQQLQPDNHPIALLSSKPSLSLYDSYLAALQHKQSPFQWLSYKHLVYALEESRETYEGSADGKNDCAAFEYNNQEVLRPQPLFYPAVLHEQTLLSTLARASTQYCASCKSLQQSLDSCQGLLETQKNLQRLYEHAQSTLDCSNGPSCPSCDGVVGALPETQKAASLKCRCSFYCYQYDEQPLVAQEYGQYDVHTQGDVELLDRDCLLVRETDCIPSHTRYQLRQYSHPYTLEQRDLAAPLVLGIVRVEALDDPFVVVRDITVDVANSYITFGGIVNRNCWIGFDELTQWSTPFAFNYMGSRLRTTDPSLTLYMRATTNPGGPGHTWVKKGFVDPSPANTAFDAVDFETGEVLKFPKGHSKEGEALYKRRFIPATLFDNPYLAKDGQYESMLLALPENQRRQLLYGDWDVSDGAAFPEFNRRIHVIDPFPIPNGWTRFRAADYGYGSMTAVLWFAVSPSEQLIVYRELCVKKVTAVDLADMINDIEKEDKIRYGVLDSSLWHRRGDTGPSLAEQMIMRGCRWRPSDRSKGSRVAGKNELHRRLQIDEYTNEPRLVFFSTCTNLIAELPVLPLDRNNPEDVDTNANDHSYDALRYGIMSRPRSSIWDYDPASNGNKFKPADSVLGY